METQLKKSDTEWEKFLKEAKKDENAGKIVFTDSKGQEQTIYRTKCTETHLSILCGSK